MKTVANLADATRLAARNGATLAVGGRLVNAAGAQLDVVPRPAPRAPEPPPATAPGVTAADVDRMLAERDAKWREYTTGLQRQIDLLAAAANTPRRAPTWRLTRTLDSKGEIAEIVAEPHYP